VQAITFKDLCRVMRATGPMSYGLSSEEDIEQLLTLALVLQEREAEARGGPKQDVEERADEEEGEVQLPQGRLGWGRWQGAARMVGWLQDRRASARGAAPEGGAAAATAARGRAALQEWQSRRRPCGRAQQSPSSSELDSDSDEDLAASRAALKADERREGLRRLLASSLGRQLFGAQGAAALPGKVGVNLCALVQVHAAAGIMYGAQASV